MKKPATFARRLLPTFRIRERIVALVAVPVAGLLALGGAYLLADQRIETAFNDNLVFQGILDEADDLEIAVLQMRRREKDYLLLRGRENDLRERKDELYLEAFNNHAEKARSILQMIEDEASKLDVLVNGGEREKLSDTVAKLKIDLKAYVDKFEIVVGILRSIGMRSGEGLDARLQQAADGVNAIVSEAGLDRLTVEMLKLREDQVQFIQSRDRRFVKNFKDRLYGLETLIEESTLDPLVQSRVSVMLATYQVSFESFAYDWLDLDVQRETLAEIFDRMEPAYRQIADGAEMGLAISEANLTRTREGMRLVWLVLAVGIGTFVLLLGISMSRSVIGPIRSITHTFGQIADGASNVEIPFQDQRDEIGDMANALAGFYGVSVSAMRAESAVAMASTNVMITDPEHRILSLNRSAEKMFAKVETDLHSEIADFAADDLIGASLHLFGQSWIEDGVFDQVIGQQDDDDLLPGEDEDGDTDDEDRDDDNSTAVRSTIGGRTFDIIFTPVLNRKNERLGTVCEWKDMTERLAVEGEIAEIVRAAGEGDFSQRLTEANKIGFMADLANGMNELLDVVDHGLKQVVRIMSALAEGDLTKRMQGEHKGAFAKLKADADRMGDQMEDMVSRITTVSTAVKTATGEISSGMTKLSGRTEHQASSLEETTASMEELSATVRQNAGNANEANQVAVTAREAAVSGGEVADKAVSAMDGIAESSRKINDIVGLIQEIAFQTNLLALNASVEAARAGEAGRGFAVVANEVRALAQRAAAASKDIKTLISNSGDQVQEGVKLVGEAGEALDEIVGAVKKVADFVSEIATASQEQTSGIDQVSGAITAMDEMTQQNAALVEETTGAIMSAVDQVEDLQKAVGFFSTAQGGGAKPVVGKAGPPAQNPAGNAVHDQQQRLSAGIGGRKAAAGSGAAAAAVGPDDWEEF